MKLEFSEKKAGTGSVELLLKGELTIYSVKLLNDKLKSLINDFKSIKIDLDKVVKIDSAGFQLLVSTLKSDVRISFEKYSEEVTKIFSFYGEKI
jgi:anti-anti-sigma factor